MCLLKTGKSIFQTNILDCDQFNKMNVFFHLIYKSTCFTLITSVKKLLQPKKSSRFYRRLNLQFPCSGPCRSGQLVASLWELRTKLPRDFEWESKCCYSQSDLTSQPNPFFLIPRPWTWKKRILIMNFEKSQEINENSYEEYFFT